VAVQPLFISSHLNWAIVNKRLLTISFLACYLSVVCLWFSGFYNVLALFMKYQRDTFMKTGSICELLNYWSDVHENRPNDTHTLLKDINGFLLAPSIFFDQFWWNLIQKILTQCHQTAVSFMKIGTVEDILYFSAQFKFCTSFLHVLYDMNKFWYRCPQKFVGWYMFHRTHCSDNLTLFRGEMELMSILSKFIAQFWWKLVWRSVHEVV